MTPQYPVTDQRSIPIEGFGYATWIILTSLLAMALASIPRAAAF